MNFKAASTFPFLFLGFLPSVCVLKLVRTRARARAALGNYTISAVADVVTNETDTLDNTLIDGWVVVTWLGDFDGDDDIDFDDIVSFADAYIEYWSS